MSCAYTICSYGQTLISCTIPSGPKHTDIYIYIYIYIYKFGELKILIQVVFTKKEVMNE